MFFYLENLKALTNAQFEINKYISVYWQHTKYNSRQCHLKQQQKYTPHHQETSLPHPPGQQSPVQVVVEVRATRIGDSRR